ncbi:ribosome biogenesis protein tsr1 [Recurvomyces mirabilis]|uniref:Ribosome biogenesis protein tsr1 n=1 Tax=Recurvomyces mirabilis TaxID=574656 RepID=A0AAE0WFA1_9PEZI|nr:ribosome biogenesis protein tsr1 [Recurvomyces mirabilis]KAK5158212.1 ribosome biogenesis protein tsr1 [Recurvomyces mirabilis]
MVPTTDHHHRSTTKSSNKPFKTKHATKSALKERSKGKVEKLEVGNRKTPHQQVMSKIDRRNHAKQLRQNKLGERREEGSVFTGRDGAPRIVAVVPLCSDVESATVVKHLNESMDVDEAAMEGGRVEVPRFKTRVQYLTPARELFAVLDACRVVDFVLFVLSAEEEVDELGEQMLRTVESQGVSTVLTGAYGLDKIEPTKRRPDVLKSLKSFITHFFAMQEKVYDFSSRQDCSNVMRSLCTTTPRGISWRETRSWMTLDDVRWEEAGPVVTGTIRGKNLKVDRLVQVGDWGDFQIERVTAATIERSNKRAKPNDMAVDATGGEQELEQPGEDQDNLAELAPEEIVMDDAMSMPAPSMAASERKHVLLDDHQYFDEDEQEDIPMPKRLPRGTSKYQAAWYLGDMSDSGSDMTDVEPDRDGDFDMDGSAALGPADGHFESMTMRDPTEAGASEYPQSEFFPDKAPQDEAEQIAAYRKQRREEAEDDLEFPDEIELHPGMDARERLARYRGLKSLRNSKWETEEDRLHEPEDWSRLLEISDYKSAKNRVLKEALTGGIKAGTRVHIHLRLSADQCKEQMQALPTPTSLFSLLRHEHKLTSVNASMSLSSEYGVPLKSKEELIMQCGPRRLVINPIFSQAGNTPNNVHKFDRYLHPGMTAVASFIGPVIWGSVPCLYFMRREPSQGPANDPVEDLGQSTKTSQAGDRLGLIATGTFLPPSTTENRIITKRIILTGHPYKIHKKLVTVRYMFFSDADVEYFSALQLWTRRGRSGFVKEPLGTHGYFKATFDGKINPLDSVAVSLYKRVWPRKARAFVPGQFVSSEGKMGGVEEVGDEVPMLVEA